MQNHQIRAPCGARCMGHAVRTWSAVYSEAPQSQFGEGARPHLRMNEWNRPIPVRRQLSLIQVVRGKFILTGLALVLGMKTRVWMYSRSSLLRVPSTICSLRKADAKSGKVV